MEPPLQEEGLAPLQEEGLAPLPWREGLGEGESPERLFR